MTERQKRLFIIGGVIVLALILWLMGGKSKDTVVQTPNGPVVFGNVSIPGVNFPPRNSGDGIIIPGLNLGSGFPYGASTCMCDGGLNPTPFIPTTTVNTMQSTGPVFSNAYVAPVDTNFIYGFG